MKLEVHKKHLWSKEDKDSACGNFICLFFLLDNVNSVLQNVFNISENILTLEKSFIAAFLFVYLLRIVLHFNKREFSFLIIAEVFVFLLYFYSFLAGAELNRLIDWAVTTLGVCVPLFVCAWVIDDKKMLYRQLIKYSYIVFLLLIINMQVNTTGKRYDLHFSYALLLIVLLHLNELISGKNALYVLTVSIGVLMLVMFGSRGTLVCILFFLILKVLTNVENSFKRVIAIAFLGVVFCGIHWIMNNEMVVYDFFAEKGLSSRTLKLIAQGSFLTHNSGRAELWSATILSIQIKPWLGWGIRGAIDRLNGHPYPHQLFLDMWLSFGVPFGTFLSTILVLPVKRVFVEPKGVNKDLIQIFWGVGFIPLMYSGTIFTNQYFFIFLGLAFVAISNYFKIGSVSTFNRSIF